MNKCTKHLKYTGKKKPKTQCVDCFNYYIKLGKLYRSMMSPSTKIHRDKTRYSRKKKHKYAD